MIHVRATLKGRYFADDTLRRWGAMFLTLPREGGGRQLRISLRSTAIVDSTTRVVSHTRPDPAVDIL